MKRKVVYLEPHIVKAIDIFREDYVDYYRGQVMTIILGLFAKLSEAEQQEYLNRAVSYAEGHRIWYGYVPWGERQVPNIPVQMRIFGKQIALFDQNDDKIVIIAALLYARILRKGEDGV